jgi:hypothetical protein
MKRLRRPLRMLSLLPLLALIGCVTAKVEQIRQASGPAPALADGESVVVLTRRQHNQTGEESFIRCLEQALAARRMPVMGERQLADELFPWLEPRLAPLKAEALPELMDRPGVAQRVRAARVRYMIWVDGQSESSDRSGSMSCAVAPGFAGCLGFTMWDKEADYRAEIWDLETREALGKVSVRATGTSYMPALLVPVPIVAPTDSAACKAVAEQLSDLIRPG